MSYNPRIRDDVIALGFCQAKYALRLFVAALMCFGIAGSNKSLSQPSLSADQWGIEGACPRSLGPTQWSNCLTLAQRWVAETCPRSLGPSLYTDCVRREVEALRKPLPTLSHLPPEHRRWVVETCPLSLGPSLWRDCTTR